VAQDELKANDKCGVLANGKEMSKRMGNALVRKQVNDSETSTPASTEQPSQLLSLGSQPPSAQL
jgi:hypothetical protein